MNWKLFLTTAAANLFSWHLIAKEVIGVGGAWGCYFMATTIMQNPEVSEAELALFTTTLTYLFWPMVVISILSFIVACIKSPIPAAIAWIAVVPLYLLDFNMAARIALILSGVGTGIYGTAFAFLGPQLLNQEEQQ